MKIPLSISRSFLPIVLIIVLVACAPDIMYNEFRTLSPKGWSANTRCDFEVEVNDTNQLYNVQINIRHSGSYPYRNLHLLIERMLPDSTLLKDSIVCDLADRAGKWLGKGSGSVYLLPATYQPLKVDVPGKYVYKIRHAMSDEYLKGIYAIGLSIKAQNGKE